MVTSFVAGYAGDAGRRGARALRLDLVRHFCQIRAMVARTPARNGISADPEVLAILRALADPNRFRLFCALRGMERCVRDLVASEGMAQPLVSHHLRVLERAGLVRARRSHGFTLYALDPRGLAAAKEAVMDLLDPESLSALAMPGGNSDCCR